MNFNKNFKKIIPYLMFADIFNAKIGKGEGLKRYNDDYLESEYKLIKQKKSRLSRQERDGIVWQYERKLKKEANNESLLNHR